MTGPTLPFSEEIHATKYRMPGETFEAAMRRVAGALKDNSAHEAEFLDILMDMRFMPGGRVQGAMDSDRKTTPYNCFVSGTIQDSFVADEGSIMDRAKEAATTMRLGGGIGYNFGTLRPKGALIKKLRSQSSGPISFMEIYNAVCKCTASAGNRRGAQMAVLPVWHPDILDFIKCKQDSTSLTGFNISVGVTDEFMRAVLDDAPFQLQFGGEVYRTVSATELWDDLMRSTWDWAEPGVLFLDTINRMNNLWYCETIAATNPCGEQPLPPNGACLLGSFNLVKYLRHGPESEGRFYFDWDQLDHDIPHVVRAMDNIVDRAVYPLEAQEEEALSKRRMGIGVTGLANCLEALGAPYGSREFVELEREVLGHINNSCYMASAQLAEEKGCFPLYDNRFTKSEFFMKALHENVQDAILEHGIRNSHLTSIAPTGTISMAADNVSSGIEPVFAYSQTRRVLTPQGPVETVLEDYGVRALGVQGKRAEDVSLEEHLQVLFAAQDNVDSAVSKTCNVPSSVDFNDFKQLYMRAWQGGAKGCTTFRLDGKRFGILQSNDKPVEPELQEGASCRIVNGKRECE